MRVDSTPRMRYGQRMPASKTSLERFVKERLRVHKLIEQHPPSKAWLAAHNFDNIGQLIDLLIEATRPGPDAVPFVARLVQVHNLTIDELNTLGGKRIGVIAMVVMYDATHVELREHFPSVSYIQKVCKQAGIVPKSSKKPAVPRWSPEIQLAVTRDYNADVSYRTMVRKYKLKSMREVQSILEAATANHLCNTYPNRLHKLTEGNVQARNMLKGKAGPARPGAAERQKRRTS